MALVAPVSDSIMAAPTSSSFMLDFNSPGPSSINLDSLPNFSSSSSSMAQLTPGSLVSFTNPFASTSTSTPAPASVPRRQQLVSTEVIGPATPDMASVFAPSFAGYSPSLMSTADMSLFDNSASVNPSVVTSVSNMHTRHMSLALPMHMHNSVSTASGSNVGSPSLLPTDLTHSSNVMAGRRMSLPNNLSSGVASSHVDPQTLIASSSSSAYTHLPFVSEIVDELGANIGPTPSNVSLAQGSPSPASVPASEPSQYVMQMREANSNRSGPAFSVDARRMSMPMLSMSNSVNPDGTVPLHARRKNSVAASSDRSASHSPRTSLGDSSMASAHSHRSSSVSDDVNQSITLSSPNHQGVAFNPGMVPVAVNSYGLVFHDQGQQGMHMHPQPQSESESEEDPLPCEIARIPKAILFNGSRPVPGHLGSTVSVPASNTRNGSTNSQNGTAVAALMTTFNSKVSSGTQKKHKCPICHKRFTRPSSLQTHMYSHTGEKPFTCDFRGCGRKFSVVSNLRRHKKIHSSSSRSH
ncbi:hypothetical protein V1520DRAFT_336480 [Lipomyces starkeyi]|uniref:C2H2-type domain-containing protein n=1 Tax=Lipomyces starkeyi NRRL Y-11557 TaxID=675824 RepID=A0A1E3QDQ5_LIPST|nr:hypothetical protein LIPSTDRAFT_217420 [Lipomyces starkeyi NRRL Y-11557]